ncbi:MAG: S24 family peptidase [Sedimenticola sp.]
MISAARESFESSFMTQDCSYNELYALQAMDDSMEPEFPNGCVIVIEPSEGCATGAYVVATVNGERWFRQYRKDGQGGEKLVALNSDYPEIDLAGTQFRIEGVIVQRNIKREVKHYQPFQPNNGENEIPLQ